MRVHGGVVPIIPQARACCAPMKRYPQATSTILPRSRAPQSPERARDSIDANRNYQIHVRGSAAHDDRPKGSVAIGAAAKLVVSRTLGSLLMC